MKKGANDTKPIRHDMVELKFGELSEISPLNAVKNHIFLGFVSATSISQISLYTMYSSYDPNPTHHDSFSITDDFKTSTEFYLSCCCLDFIHRRLKNQRAALLPQTLLQRSWKAPLDRSASCSQGCEEWKPSKSNPYIYKTLWTAQERRTLRQLGQR